MTSSQTPVAWVSEEELTELLNCNGMSIWAESPNVWQDVESEQLVPLFKYQARTPRDTSDHDKEIIEKLENKIDRLEWENKGIAEWRDEYIRMREQRDEYRVKYNETYDALDDCARENIKLKNANI